MGKTKKSAANAAADQKTDATPVASDETDVTDILRPWDKPVDGEALLAEIVKQIRAHMSITRTAAQAVALWIVYTHVCNEFRISPILGVVSPTRRCGKTTLLTIIGFLAQRALATTNITPAALFRAMNAGTPTLLVDEIDSFGGQQNGLRGILNSGHARESAYVMRTVGKHAVQFMTWGPKVLAQIGSLPSTLEDRAIVVHLRRKAPHEEVRKLHAQSKAEFAPLAQKIMRWAQDNAQHLGAIEPEMPPKLHDRAEDNWRPLLAIAERIGGSWPQHARKAARLLSDASAEQNAAHGEMLLQDLRGILGKRTVKAIESAEMITALRELEDRPWPVIFNGRLITKAKLAALLRPFGIKPKLQRDGGRVFRGYVVADFTDAFERYAA